VRIVRRILPLSCLVGLLASSSSARAGEPTPQDLATAKALFQQGSTLLNAGRYSEACPILESAQRLVQGIGVTLYLAECYERTGRLVSAWEQFDRARGIAKSQHDRRADLAGERAQKLWSRLPKLELVVRPIADVPGLQLTDDGAPIDRVAYNVERPAEPRTHHIRARAPDRAPWEAAIEIPATPATIRVEVPPLGGSPIDGPSGTTGNGGPSAGAAPTPDNSAATSPNVEQPPPTWPPAGQSGRPSTQRIASIALFGVGVAGLVAGTFFGLEARSKMDDSNTSGNCQSDNHCNAAGLAQRSSALTAATLSTVGFVGGVAFTVGGATLYLTAPDDRPPRIALAARPAPGGGSLVLQGRW
jgi:hypothetical protein